MKYSDLYVRLTVPASCARVRLAKMMMKNDTKYFILNSFVINFEAEIGHLMFRVNPDFRFHVLWFYLCALYVIFFNSITEYCGLSKGSCPSLITLA